MNRATVLSISLLALTSFGQNSIPNTTTPVGALPDDPAALLNLASEVNGLHGSDLKPWHLHATWQSLDDKKQVKKTGTWEEWWEGDKKYKIVVSSEGDQQTLWSTDQGVFVVRGGRNPSDTAEILDGSDALSSADFALLPNGVSSAGFLLERLLTRPVPELTSSGISHMRLQESANGVGTAPVCALQAFILPDGNPHVSSDRDGRFLPSLNRYCFDHDSPILRVESAPGQVITFNSLVRFQDHYLARSIHIAYTSMQVRVNNDPTLTQTKRSYAPVEEAEIAVDQIEPLNALNDAELTPPKDAIQMPGIRAVAIAEGIMAGERTGGDLANYPSEARQWHIQGTVVVSGTILEDGTMTDLRANGGPRALQQGALDSIKKWRFEPYLAGGKPVKVATQIRMNFNYN